MTGKVKAFYHDEICERANDEPWGPEPDGCAPDIAIPSKAEAFDRLFKLLAASSPVWRTPQQDKEIDRQRDICSLANLREEMAKHG